MAINSENINCVGEKRMWVAAIAWAIRDIKQVRKKNSDEAIRNYDSAVAWLNRNNDMTVGSFLWVCEFLSINPDLVRKQILGV